MNTGLFFFTCINIWKIGIRTFRNIFINDIIEFLTVEIPKVIKEEDTDLLNIRDEILAELNKLKYLLTLS